MLILILVSALWRETPVLPTLPATWAAVIYLIVFGSVGAFVLAGVYIGGIARPDQLNKIFPGRLSSSKTPSLER